ncbi:MerR family transcriptional regulator [Salinibacterium sp. dk2585]|uniref:MerR family transcriptional regulator n=1 Tax=unclassified Salinibacterium TaxID=2632331 RepID=UPI0011C24FB5|nr:MULTISPECIES: MerR family transcriptional regulator [unclassified Salinibacterium]QEE60259.1 MerR family transcriptional regulator [Salinibacterium sp. dk2585]TXK55331.1 MerR family transcriptional regulator [Salinibacterium sp. dk5596]
MEYEESQTMQIGEVAEKTGLSLRTLRHYDEIGLLRASDRSEGGFRLYTNRDLQRLLLIRRMKPLGFSLEEMNELLGVIDQLQASGDAESPNTRERLAAFVHETKQRREKLVRQVEMADEFLDLLSNQ